MQPANDLEQEPIAALALMDFPALEKNSALALGHETDRDLAQTGFPVEPSFGQGRGSEFSVRFRAMQNNEGAQHVLRIASALGLFVTGM